LSSRFALPSEFEDCIGIFQGGGCRAAAYAGAYSAALEKGVNFNEVAGASAGAIAAVLIAAGAPPDWLERHLSELDFTELISRPKGRRFPTDGKRLSTKIYNLIRFNGVYDGSRIEDWVEARLRDLLPGVLNPKVQFSDLPRPVAVIAANLEIHGPKVWSSRTTPDESVAEAVRSSCTIPFFFQPHGPFVDGGVVSNLPLHIVENDPADLRRVLAFSLVDSGASKRPRDVLNTALSLSSTITEGGKAVQQALHGNVDVISIRCGDIKATDFDSMTSEKVQFLIDAGRAAVDDFFGAGSAAVMPFKPASVSTHLALTLTTVAEHLLQAQSRVLISMANTKWVFDLYTALLIARMKNVEVRVVLPHDMSNSHDSVQQRETLRALGCSVTELSAGADLPVQAFVCDPGQHGAAAVVMSRADLEINARLLSSEDGDEDTIDLVARTIDELCTATPRMTTLSLVPAVEEDVIASLRTVKQYGADVSIELREVPLDQITAWARYAHVYKQRQQREMLRVLRDHGQAQFNPYFVRYTDEGEDEHISGTQSLALPIVLEQRPDGHYIVVNGLSRLLLLLREKRTTAFCAVVVGVTAPAPAVGVEPLSYLGVRVGVRGDASHRYPGFVYQNSRPVERGAHALRPVGVRRGGGLDDAHDGG
jgi:predicted acylesterase/phospholipase RssA